MRQRSVVAALVVVAAAGLGGCGEDGADRVATYIDAANEIQRDAAPAVERANAAYRRFAEGKLQGDAAARQLAASERTVRALRARISALRPPDEARGLHGRLVTAFTAHADLAAESTLLARYLPAAADIVRPIPAINRRLRLRLALAATPAGQTAALERYARGVDGVLARLRRVPPAPVVRRSHDAQLRRLAEVSGLARRLGRAIARRDSRGVARLLLRFRRASADQGRSSRLGRQAIAAYNRRYRDVFRKLAAVQRERTRLERELT